MKCNIGVECICIVSDINTFLVLIDLYRFKLLLQLSMEILLYLPEGQIVQCIAPSSSRVFVTYP